MLHFWLLLVRLEMVEAPKCADFMVWECVWDCGEGWLEFGGKPIPIAVNSTGVAVANNTFPCSPALLAGNVLSNFCNMARRKWTMNSNHLSPGWLKDETREQRGTEKFTNPEVGPLGCYVKLICNLRYLFILALNRNANIGAVSYVFANS